MKKLVLLLSLSIGLANVFGQDWTTCGATAGLLNGKSTGIKLNDTTAAPKYVKVPSMTGTDIRTEFLIVRSDSMASDNLGNTIIMSSKTGIFQPSNVAALAINDTFWLIPVTYDLNQWKVFCQSILYESVPFVGSCCAILDAQATAGICDSLNAAGIADSSDLKSLKDIIEFTDIYSGYTRYARSLRGLKNLWVDMNGPIVTLETVGCTGGVKVLCYAFDSSSSNHEEYVVIKSCKDTRATISETACDSFVSPSGKIWSSSNTYLDTIPNAAKCDSVITINLTIVSIDSSVTQAGALLTANQAGASYQWLDCPEITPIDGATSQTFEATSNGAYAVRISKSGCADTSACYTVSGVGILNNDFGANFQVYPNPTDGNFSIDLGTNYPSIQVSVKAMNGETVQSHSYRQSQRLNLSIQGAAGVYLVQIESEGKKAQVRLVKK